MFQFLPALRKKLRPHLKFPLWTRGVWITRRVISCMTCVNSVDTVLKTQRSSTQDVQGNLDVPVTGAGNRGCPPADVAGRLQRPTFVLEKRCKRHAAPAAFVADEKAETEHARRRNSELKP